MSDRLRAVAHRLLTFLSEIWRRDWAVLLAVCALNLFVSRRTWGGGIWADNDSVCHYAYLRHLLEEFYPATGTYMGFSPKFNMGVPFLLYNTPPGLYVAAAVVAKVTGASALVALKLVVVAAYLSVPLLGYALAATFEQERSDFPKIAAITLSLFSSELFGLEFYFKNGMLNPALGIPLMMGTLVAYRRAQRAAAPRSFLWVGVGALAFAATLFTHMLSAYMLCVALLAFVIGGGRRTFGANAIKLGALVGLGVLVTAEWLYPSMKFAAVHDAAYTWSRDWHTIVSDFLDGSLLSSYPVGFDPSFVTQSNVSGVALAAGAFGAVVGVRRRNTGVISCLIGFVLAFILACGPAIHFGVAILPLYDKLLWYRFITLVAIMWLMVAAYGAAEIAKLRGRYYPLNVAALVFALGISVYILFGRAVKIGTASVRAQFDRSTVETAEWLREHGDRRGRVFSEFLNTNGVAAISVNYPRHMIPILSGFDEAAGWIYENNPATQGLMRKGPFWFDPLPMIEEADHYDVKYIVAGSSQFVRALTVDPRWKLVHETPDLYLFERVGFEPSLAVGAGLRASVTKAEYLRGGGYAYDLEVRQESPGPATLLVKTNDSPAWRITVDGVAVQHRATSDGLLLVDLPPSAVAPRHVELRWSIEPWRRLGRRGTLVGLGAVVVLLAFGARRRSALRLVPPRVLQAAGVGASALVLVACVFRARPLPPDVGGYGVAGGIEPVRDLAVLEVGAYDDDEPTRPNHVLPDAWSGRSATATGVAMRTLRRDAPAAVITLGGHDRLTITLATGEPRELRVTLSGKGAHCTFLARTGTPTDVPAECRIGDDARAMGHPRFLAMADAAGLGVRSIAVENDVRYLEAESLENTVYDGGCEAFYAMGAQGYSPSNGVVMTAGPSFHCSVDMGGHADLPAGRYGVWVLARAFHPRYRMTRGDITVLVGGRKVGTFDGTSAGHDDFWDSQGHFEWIEVGEATSSGGQVPLNIELRRKPNAVGSGIDFDALAFAPRP